MSLLLLCVTFYILESVFLLSRDYKENVGHENISNLMDNNDEKWSFFPCVFCNIASL